MRKRRQRGWARGGAEVLVLAPAGDGSLLPHRRRSNTTQSDATSPSSDGGTGTSGVTGRVLGGAVDTISCQWCTATMEAHQRNAPRAVVGSVVMVASLVPKSSAARGGRWAAIVADRSRTAQRRTAGGP